MKTFQKIMNYMHGYRLIFMMALAASLLTQFAVMIAPLIIKIAIDNVFSNLPFERESHRVFVEILGGAEYLKEHLWILGLLFFATYLVRGILTFLRSYGCGLAGESMAKNLKDRLYDHIQRLPYSYHVRVETGDLIQRCTSDVNTVKMFVAGQQLMGVLSSTFLLILIVGMMFTMNVKLTLMSVAVLPITFLFAIRFFKIIQKTFREFDESEARMTTRLQEVLTGVRVVKAFGRQKEEIERFEEKNAELRDLDFKVMGKFSTYWMTSDLFCYSQVAFVVIAGAYFCYHGEITVGTMVAFISYINTLIWPVRQMGRELTEMSKTSVALDRIEQVLNEEPERLFENGETPELSGHIVFKDVVFKYEDGIENVLNGVSFEIGAGKTLALIGPTGSGKSSLVQLLSRLYDYNSGSIRIDGRELKELDRGWIRRNIGLILQEPFLFAKTVKENIRLANPDFSEEQVEEAAKVASIHRDILSFEKGYDTMVGEKGVSLSGGQKQRMAIARTIINHSPIVIFDDSLSAVDTETDIAIRKALEARKDEATTIIISHRISTVKDADLILVLHDGVIIEQGTHERLMENGGMYRRIYDIQNAPPSELEQGGE